ncbi:MAG: YcgN family cysteine cluster protein [Deltaproteobacteria bacterium]|jgi:uncharacterized cysteine cluster protein YcgN (CxxCxxCC family)
MNLLPEPFWKTKPLEELTPEEWEALCDGCGRCCLHKVEYKDTGETFYTNVACHLLDTWLCRCVSYEERFSLVPTCLLMTPQKAAELAWLPPTCGYRRLALGMDLDWWHPLVSGNPDTVHQAGISVRGKVLPEEIVPLERLEEHIIEF